jgi:hypothetical protein
MSSATPRAGRPGGGRARVLAFLPALLIVAGCGGATATPSPAAATAAPSTATVAPTSAPTPAATAAATAAASPAASAGLDPVALVAMFAGKYSGTWKNTTFGSTGAAALDVSVDRTAKTVSITITLGGNVFGAPAPAPETLTAPIAASGLTVTSKTFGQMTVTAVPDGAGWKVSATAADVPSARIKSFTTTGTVTNPASLQLTYTVGFRDSTPAAQGTISLTRS